MVELTLENRLLKKSVTADEEACHMRYPASEKLEIIRLVEESALPVRRTLEKVGIPRATFYRWYDLYQAGGREALDDRHPKPDRVWRRRPVDLSSPSTWAVAQQPSGELASANPTAGA